MSASPVSVDLPDGRTISANKGPEGQEPEVLSVRKGPYTGHMLIYQTDSGIQVAPPVYIENNRPAIFDPQNFFDFDVVGRKFTNKADIRGEI